MDNQKLLEKINNIDSMLQDVQNLRILLKKTMRAEQEDYAERGLDWSTSNEQFESDNIRDKLIEIVNTWVDDINDIVSFIQVNKNEIIELCNRKKDDEEEKLDEETEEKLQKILSDEKLSDMFFNEVFPKNIMKEFNISREEYNEILNEAIQKADKEEILEAIIDKLSSQKQVEFTPFYSISQQLEDKANENSIYKTSKWF